MVASTFAVTQRLIALLLALMVGSPLCWCCQPAGTKATNGAARACCQSRQERSTGRNENKQQVPCPHSFEKRLMAKAAIPVPPPALTLLLQDGGDVVILIHAPALGSTHLMQATDKPHLRRVPLFVDYCAFLT